MARTETLRGGIGLRLVFVDDCDGALGCRQTDAELAVCEVR